MESQVDPNTKINGQPVGLFNFTYNDLRKQTKISLEDVGILAYGNFILYEPARMKWFKEFKERAEAKPDVLVWKLLRVRKRIFEPRNRKPIEEELKHYFQKEKNKRSNIFNLQVSTCCGKKPLTVGFIVSVKDHNTRIWYKLCEDRREKQDMITESSSYNFTYPGSGKFHGYFIALNKDEHWQKTNFEITVEEDPIEEGDIITNFHQGIAAGITNLDVSFGITSGRDLKRTEWVFNVEKPPPKPKKGSVDRSVHNNYEYREKPYVGTVTAWDHEGNCRSREFYVIIGQTTPKQTETSDPCVRTEV